MAAACSVMTLFACTACNLPVLPHATQLDGIDIADVYAVAYLTPQASTSLPTDPGAMVFIYPDGSYRSVQNKGIDMADIDWTEHGLVFRDASHDFRMREHQAPQIWDNDKESPDMDAMVTLDNGTEVALYNGGYGADGEEYFEYASVRSGNRESTHETKVDALTIGTAHCSTGLYGLQMIHDSGRHGDALVIAVSLWQWTDTQDYVGRKLAEYEGPTPNISLSDATACADDEFLAITNYDITTVGRFTDEPAIVSRNVEDSSVQTEPLEDYLSELHEDNSFPDVPCHSFQALTKYNVRTGERTILPLHAEDGTPALVGEQESDVATADGLNYQNGSLYWVSGRGRIMKTDPQTGTTQVINDEHAFDGFNSTKSIIAWFTEGFVDVWMSDGDHDIVPDIHIRRYALGTGQCVRDTVVKGLNGKLSLRLVDRGFAVNPKAKQLLNQ